MSIKIMREATDCACGTPLGEFCYFLNGATQEICEDCFQIEMDEDENNE